ncbi:GDSL-type esterase/lipase family protein [Rheinheimera sp. UJ63]|uniref:GDSL-type esterase/lipase family protein n=1 Tax=Rheinheimera sp. UJ63 TaxID=2910157 RepID=UPI001F30A100|nr:GDSL-type esterase/lipase family protein [Rheinheimera sp. UJ63]MCF4007793.1 GDSL-type esterase/lipase family protein [Rheinheimera sp. UJ63]
MNSFRLNRTHSKAFFLLLLVLLPALTALACRSYFHRQTAADKSWFYQQSLEIMYHRQALNLPVGSVVFFGDSQIQGLAVTAISPKAVNFGIGHQQLQRLAFRIADYPNLERAERIFIGIGINDLLHAPSDDLERAISQLISGLRCCHSKVTLLSILPVNEVKLARPGLNKQIVKLNEQLKAAANQAGLNFIDYQTSFSDLNGHLNIRYDLGDGLHLSQAGYDHLIEKIKTGLLGAPKNAS